MMNIMYWPGPKVSRGFPFHSFHLPSKEKIKKLKKKKQEAKEKQMARMTDEERAELKIQEEEMRLREMDPLSRFGEFLKRYEKEVQACIDFSTELRVSLREIDDLNAEADKIEAEYRQQYDQGPDLALREERSRNDADADRRDEDGERGSRRSRASEPDDKDDDTDAPAEGRNRKRRPRRAREPREPREPRGDDSPR